MKDAIVLKNLMSVFNNMMTYTFTTLCWCNYNEVETLNTRFQTFISEGA